MFSYEFCEIFKNQFFYKTPLVVASVANCHNHTVQLYKEEFNEYEI